MKTLNEMNKAELRAECKVVGVKGYGNMTNDAMRGALANTREDARSLAETGHANCPHCNTQLTNGYWDVDALVQSHLHNGEKKAALEVNAEGDKKFWCMACDKFFGEARTPLNLTPKARKAPETTGIKIEKNREERNGIKRPSIGGVCREIWDFCDAQAKTPALKEVKAQAVVKGWDLVTTAIQYYQWRKFSSIVGRI